MQAAAEARLEVRALTRDDLDAVDFCAVGFAPLQRVSFVRRHGVAR